MSDTVEKTIRPILISIVNEKRLMGNVYTAAPEEKPDLRVVDRATTPEQSC
jgi:hypothetical protein